MESVSFSLLRHTPPDFILKQSTLQSARKDEKILIQHQLSYYKKFYTLHYQSPHYNYSQYGYNATKPLECPIGYIVGSCNEIICLREVHAFLGCVSLWNPSIRRKLTIPYHDLLTKICVVHGFGFDSMTDDYKIVIIRGEESIIYSLKKRVCDVSKEFILTFDLSTHVFSEMMLPEEPKQSTIQRLIIFNGSLGMLVSTKDCYHHRVWVMKEYNNVTSWYMTLNFGNCTYEGGVDAVLQLKNGNFVIHLFRNHKRVMDVYPNGAV
ncbi:F-box/kelch-repeat protein At3g06240-like [Rutidosis leptorrhynchoides]|uniref:F-box/kelch-repeat protein At3g06240-like n=1 Tax=Rutidosis leptorrhynchoides TaxID=125765 RepID=UPI003A9A1D44